MKGITVIVGFLLFAINLFSQVEIKKDSVYQEQWPEFPGGDDSLFTFIEKNLQYPKPAIERMLEGKIYVLFIINEDGKISDAEIEKSKFTVNKKHKKDLKDAKISMESEALRIVNSFKYWKPGTINGKIVKSKYLLPITFSLRD